MSGAPDKLNSEAETTSLEESLGVRFKSPDLLTEALTHRSYAFESEAGLHNERLEFLGDAVLGLVVTDMIFTRYPELSEGEMAKVRAGTVNSVVLADMAAQLDLGEHVLLGRGEELSGGREKQSILGDAFEAVLGAVYLDQGWGAARRLVERLLGDFIKKQVESDQVTDFKTSLQELVARYGELPDYRITSSGPDHDKFFRARVFIEGKEMGRGHGRSKKEAEQAAAREALSRMTQEL